MNAKIIIILVAISVLFAGCSDYGKCVKVNSHIEVYLKGNGVTEEDAKKFGNYLDTTYKDSKNQMSFQMAKDSGQYVIRMVVDKDKVKDNALDVSFMALQFLFESQVFPGNKVKLIITDDHFKDIKSFPSLGK